MKELPIDISYKKVSKLIADFSKRYAASDTDMEILKGEINLLMVELHNTVVKEMKENAISEITKTLEKYGYKR